MNRNVGELDGRIRSRLGMILILVAVLGFFNLVQIGMTVRIVLLAIGAILYGTGSSRRCAIYSILGIDTSESKK